MNSDGKGRDGTVDILRGIGIILMIMGHIGFGDRFDLWIHGFHMPMFYIISGYFFGKEVVAFKKFVLKKVRKLMIPYFFFSGIHLILACMMYRKNMSYMYDEMRDIFFHPTDGQVPIAGALWFLPTLLWIDIIFWFLHRKLRAKCWLLWVASVVIGLGGMIVISKLGIRLPMAMDSALVGVAFMGTGYFLKEYMQTGCVLRMFKMNIIIFIFSFLINTYLIFYNGMVNFRGGSYQNIVLTLINAVMATLLWWNISRWINGIQWNVIKYLKNIVIFIGAHSLVFVCLNQLLITIIQSKLISVIPLVGRKIITLGWVCVACYFVTNCMENGRLRIFLGKVR